jgi:hypothetical protein
MKRFLLICLLFGLLPLYSGAQVNILSASVNSFNVTPSSLCQVNVMNTQGDVQAMLEADLTSTDNTLLLKVTTGTFILKKGLNSLGMNISVSSAQYGSNDVSTHIKTFHTLPSGKYHTCWTIKVLAHDAIGDQYCEDVESENTAFLFLVFPADHDTIDSPMPLLSWSHSDPFNIGSTGDYYRMVLVKLSPGQSAEAGVMSNTPMFMKNSLMTHEVQYPYDGKTLEVGERYGWQVQKISNEVIVNKTEAWDFVLRPPVDGRSVKYVVLKNKLDAGYYTSEDGKVYFRFDESYTGGELKYKVYNAANKEIAPLAKNENKTLSKQPSFKTLGYNRFCLDMNGYGAKEGFYTLEVMNAKSEKSLLKIYVK